MGLVVKDDARLLFAIPWMRKSISKVGKSLAVTVTAAVQLVLK
jgi:hypothetical protein